MKRLVSLMVMLMLVSIPGCGGETRETLAAESVSLMKEMVATMETVKDKASAQAAKPKLTELVKKMNSINERQAKLPQMTEAEGKALIDKYGKEMEELQRKLVASMMRFQFDPAIAAELQDIDMKMR